MILSFRSPLFAERGGLYEVFSSYGRMVFVKAFQATNAECTVHVSNSMPLFYVLMGLPLTTCVCLLLYSTLKFLFQCAMPSTPSARHCESVLGKADERFRDRTLQQDANSRSQSLLSCVGRISDTKCTFRSNRLYHPLSSNVLSSSIGPLA